MHLVLYQVGAGEGGGGVIVTEYMSDFNATSKKPMHLVLFQVSGGGGDDS